MQIKDKIHGFTLVRRAEVGDQSAALYEFVHDKSGAAVAYFDREDTNKTFAIAFPTLPENDSGVFHIIEHSVLCGSEKYPLKDPFAELLKGSLNTFLNAMTYEDRTVYPVSSRCERDYLNLISVYMDAVFSPMMLKNKNIFLQEGWHYEYDADSDTLSYNGVVYNEMKGAYSSPDELSDTALHSMLFDGTSYGFDSGGAPYAIPTLDYEGLCAAHEKYYHPSYAKVFLDGRQELEKVFPILDSYFSRYDRRTDTISFPKSTAKILERQTVRYEFSENEDDSSRARLLYGYVFADYSDRIAALCASVLSDVLCGSNASPLKKELLSRSLATDVSMYCSKSCEQTLTIEVRDIDADRVGEIDEVVERVIRDIAERGMEREQLEATIDNIEFKLRERDYGTLPVGIANALSAFGMWIYGARPEDALIYSDDITALRARLGSGYFEKTLLDMTLDNPRRASVLMIPDKKLAEENAAAEATRLSSVRASLTDGELSDIIEENRLFDEWQASEDSAAARASLPTLTMADIDDKVNATVTDITKYKGAEILRHRLDVNGIVYISLYFSAPDLKKEELLPLSVLSAVLLNLPTENYEVLKLQSRIKSKLGNFFISTMIAERDGVATPILKVSLSALESKKDDVIELVHEVLFKSSFECVREITDIILQAKSHIEDAIVTSGESLALSRIEAAATAAGAVSEFVTGYDALLELRELVRREGYDEFCARLSRLLAKLVVRERLTLSLVGECDDAFVDSLVSLFPSGETCEARDTLPLAENYEYFLVPSKIAHSAVGAVSSRARENIGVMRVVRSILSYEYLWNTVRVANGAYGTGFIIRKNGMIGFYSYRDPSPEKSLGYYKQSVEYLRNMAKSGDDLTKFIIGAVGEYDILLTPRTAAAVAARNYLNGYPEDDECRIRRDMLAVTCEDLLVAADIIEEMLSRAGICIVGAREHLSELTTPPKRIIEI